MWILCVCFVGVFVLIVFFFVVVFFFFLLSNNSNLCSILHLLALGMVALYVFGEIPLRHSLW
jgi:hypothetical protein